MDGLKPSHQKFVIEFIKDPTNAKKAALRAGFAPQSEAVPASRLLRIAKVAAAIKARLLRADDAGLVARKRVWKALLNIAELDPLDIYNHDGTMKALKDMPVNARLAISTIESDDMLASVRKVRFWNKNEALGLLAKTIRGLIISSHEVTGKNGAPLLPETEQIDFSKISDEDLRAAIFNYGRTSASESRG